MRFLLLITGVVLVSILLVIFLFAPLGGVSGGSDAAPAEVTQ